MPGAWNINRPQLQTALYKRETCFCLLSCSNEAGEGSRTFGNGNGLDSGFEDEERLLYNSHSCRAMTEATPTGRRWNG